MRNDKIFEREIRVKLDGFVILKVSVLSSHLDWNPTLGQLSVFG